jgi:hypothetical protein
MVIIFSSINTANNSIAAMKLKIMTGDGIKDDHNTTSPWAIEHAALFCGILCPFGYAYGDGLNWSHLIPLA